MRMAIGVLFCLSIMGAARAAEVQAPAAGQGWPSNAVPASLHGLFGLTPGASYGAQMDAAAALPPELGDEEVAWLYAFLRWHGDGRQAPLRLHAVKNDISMAIQRCTPPRADYAALLVELAADATQDATWRDYCLQHMGVWYASADRAGQESMRTALFAATRGAGRAGSFAGTALIALRRNIGAPGISREGVCAAALETVLDPGVDPRSLITALQVGATLKEARLLPTARKLAADGQDANVRASAIAALGFLGNLRADGPLLEKLAATTNPRLSVPAQGALSRLAAPSGGGRPPSDSGARP